MDTRLFTPPDPEPEGPPLILGEHDDPPPGRRDFRMDAVMNGYNHDDGAFWTGRNSHGFKAGVNHGHPGWPIQAGYYPTRVEALEAIRKASRGHAST